MSAVSSDPIQLLKRQVTPQAPERPQSSYQVIQMKISQAIASWPMAMRLVVSTANHTPWDEAIRQEAWPDGRLGRDVRAVLRQRTEYRLLIRGRQNLVPRLVLLFHEK